MSDSGSLPPDVAALLAELAAALNRRGMYPPGHPALAEAATRVAGRARAALAGHGEILIAVARDHVVHGTRATDPSQPMMRDLADRLHRRRVGGLRVAPGFDESDAGALLDALAPEPEPDAAGPAPWRSPHCALLPARYDRLTLAGAEGSGDTRSLWDDLARSAFGDGRGDAATPAALAGALNRGAVDERAERALSARLRDLVRGGELATAPELARDLAELLRQLEPERLRRLLELAGGRAEVAAMLSGAVRSLPADAVIALLRAARGPEQSVSDSLLRVLGKLSAHGQGRAAPSGADGSGALREQVEALLADWRLADPNPEAYSDALQTLAAGRSARASVPSDANRPEAKRIVSMAIELGATGPIIERAVEALAAERPAALVELASGAPGVGAGGANAAADAVWARLLAPASVARVLETSDPGDPALEALLARAGAAAIEPMLDRLAAARDRAERRWLLDRLAGFGARVAAAAAARLGAAPWQLARDILQLLRRAGGGEAVDAERFLGHENPRVRLEAVRLFVEGPTRELAIVRALADTDPDVVGAGLAAAGECPPAAVPLLARRAADPSLPTDVRAQAVRLAGAHPTEGGRDALAALVVRGRTLFLRRPRFADPSPLVLAALAALVRGWPDDPSVAEIRGAAARAKHGGIRAAARGDA